MIDQKELRIGNLVFIQGKKLITLKDQVWAIDKVVPKSCTQYDPIPITPEWLERLGFEKDGLPGWFSYPMDVIMGDGRIIYDDYEEGYRVFGTAIVVKHIHQLQNLYFALTGEELTIKA